MNENAENDKFAIARKTLCESAWGSEEIAQYLGITLGSLRSGRNGPGASYLKELPEPALSLGGRPVYLAQEMKEHIDKLRADGLPSKMTPGARRPYKKRH